MKKIRVLVVEDSPTIRKYLAGILAAAPDFEVIGEAEDGQQAIRLCEALRPDVVTMDIMLPVMSGVAATEYIMAWCPTPITIVSASVNRGEALQTYDALAAGAVDVIDKPAANEPREPWEASFLSRVRMVSRIKVITHPRGRLSAAGRVGFAAASRVVNRVDANAPEPLLGRPQSTWSSAQAGSIRVIAIGTSTGGPAAIADILRALPADFPIPLLLVIHVSDQFAFALADWLNTQSKIRVRFAEAGEPLPRWGQPGVILAPAGSHMVISGGKIQLMKGPERHSCRPSVDELFESVATQVGPGAACVLLTGMGRDGAAGLLKARGAGCITIAQDEATSIVFGMPGEAIRLGAAGSILPLPQVGPALLNLATREIGRGGAR